MINGHDLIMSERILQIPASAIEDVPASLSPAASHSSRATSSEESQRSPKRRRLRPKVDTGTGSLVTHLEAEVGELPARLKSKPKLAQKALQIGNPDVVSWVQEFAVQLEDQRYRTLYKSMPEAYGFPTVTEIKDGSNFVQMLPKLALVIECNVFGEQDHKIRKRIALAHFYHVYTLAQDNPQMFLSWCDGQQNQKSMLPKGGYKSAVQRRFADLMFPQTEHRRRSAIAADANDWLKIRIGKTQT